MGGVCVGLVRRAVEAGAGAPTGGSTVRVTGAGGVWVGGAGGGTGLGGLDMAGRKEPCSTAEPSGAGMGLGLAISAQIINEMGGTLDVRTAATGGAIFCIRLPKVP